MPEIIPIVLGVIGAGEGIFSLTHQPGKPKPVTPNPAQTQATALNTRNTQEAALSQQFPSIQAATGGSLSPEAWLRLSEILSGQAGSAGIGAASQDILQRLFGGGGGTNFNVTAGNATNPSGTGPGLTPAGSTFV